MDVRVTSSQDERAVVVHLVLGRSRMAIQVVARAPLWLPIVRLPDGLALDEPTFHEVVAAALLAFDTFREHFGR